jgi:hypothetical protein
MSVSPERSSEALEFAKTASPSTLEISTTCFAQDEVRVLGAEIN